MQIAGVLILAAGVPRAFDAPRLRRRARRLPRDAGRAGQPLVAGRAPRPEHRRSTVRRYAGGRVAVHGRVGRGGAHRLAGVGVRRDGRGRAGGAGVGRSGDEAHAVAPRAHRRALRPLHDHRAGRDDPLLVDRVPGGGRRPQRRRHRRPHRGRRAAHRVLHVVDLLRQTRRRVARRRPAIAFLWGYGHYVVFLAAAAVGAGVAVMVDSITHHAHVSDTAAAASFTIPVILYLLAVGFLQTLLHGCHRERVDRVRRHGRAGRGRDLHRSARPAHRHRARRPRRHDRDRHRRTSAD